MSVPTRSGASVGEVVAQRFLHRLGQAERAVTFAAFVVLVGVLFADVVSREISGTGIAWARQVGSYANLFVTMVGIGVASASGAHLRPHFADGWLPVSWAPVMGRVQDGLMALFFIGLALVATLAVAETRLLGDRSANPRLLVWPFQAVLPVAFLLACLRHGLYAAFPATRPSGSAGPADGPAPGANEQGAH